MKLVRLDLGLLTCHFPIFEGYVQQEEEEARLVVVIVAVAIAGIVGG